jgi:hypothetical protein
MLPRGVGAIGSKPGEVIRFLLTLVALVNLATAAFLATENSIGIRPLAGAPPVVRFAQRYARCSRAPCEIALTKIATLSDERRPGILHGSSTPTFVRDQAGRFLVRASTNRQVATFDSAGALLKVLDIPDIETSRSLTLLASPQGGAVTVTWPSGQSFTIGKDLELAPRTSRIPYMPSFFRKDGTMIVAQQIQTPELIGYPLHLLASDGRVVRSFGVDTAEYRPDLRLLLDRVAAPAAGGNDVWASPLGRYTLERWNPVSGTRLARVPVRSSWFVESANFPRDGQTRPRPIIESIWETEGLVWVLIRDADSAWQPSTEAERVWSFELYNSIYDSVIEVVDPASGAVLASKRTNSVLFGRAPQPWVASVETIPGSKKTTMTVWRPELR